MEMNINKRNLLFIDDDSVTNYLHDFMISRQIKYDGGDVDFCVNGLEAIEFLKERIRKGTASSLFPSIIFLDINMPELDGFGFLDEYKKLPIKHILNTRIIMLTSSLNDSDRAKAFSYKEVRNYLLKPLGTDRLNLILNQST
jgi:CheY-like chemotaxis protein